MSQKTYDNQPSKERAIKRLKKDGWKRDRLSAAEFHTMHQERTSHKGHPYTVEVLGVFENGHAVSIFSVSRSNRMFKEAPGNATRAEKDTFFDDDEAIKAKQDQSAARAQKAQESKQKKEEAAKKHSLLNDLVNAMVDGLDGYPKTWNVLDHFDRRNGKRYPSPKGIEFLLDNNIPLIFNPMNLPN